MAKSISEQKHIFLIAAQWALLLLAFVPYIFDRTMFFQYIEGKTVYLRAVTAITLVLLSGFFIFSRKDQRTDFIAKKAGMLRNPITLFISLFLLSVALSTVFAVDKFRAFFGNVERGEGLVGFLFFFSIFLLALLLWGRKEWNVFFSLSAVSGIILSIYAVTQFIERQGAARPFATLGNPAYLAAYLLFAIFSSLMVFGEVLKIRKPREPIVNIFLYILFLAAVFAPVVGILLTQVRGVMVGLGVGALAGAAFFVLFAGNRIWQNNIAFQRVAAGFVILVLLGSALAVLALSSGAVQKLPGFELALSRLVSKGSLETRVIAAGVSLNSIDPRSEGFVKFLVGWGPDNYRIAYNSNFNPEYFRHEVVWFDRAHNRVLDVLVMEGLLGLIAYLGIWGSALFWIIKKIRRENLLQCFESASLIFFATAYFTQNLFLFDSPATSVVIFAFFAFIASVSNGEVKLPAQMPQNQNQNSSEAAALYQTQKLAVKIMPAGIVFSSAIALALFFWATLFPYIQMKKYINLKVEGATVAKFNERLDGILWPYTYAQDQIRIDLIKSVKDFPADDIATPALRKKMFDAGVELLKREPYEPRFFMNMGLFLEDAGDLRTAEEYYRKATLIVPNRPDLAYLLGQNLVAQGKIDEARSVLYKMIQDAPGVPIARAFYGVAFAAAPDEYMDEALQITESFLDDPDAILPKEELAALRAVYERFMIVFYERRDEESFMKALVRGKWLEEEWERRETTLYLQGKIPSPPEKLSEDYAKAIEAFQVIKWDAIGIQQGEDEPFTE